jgi:hypothetical protein
VIGAPTASVAAEPSIDREPATSVDEVFQLISAEFSEA